MPIDASCCMEARKRIREEYSKKTDEKILRLIEILKDVLISQETLVRLVKEVDPAFVELFVTKRLQSGDTNVA